MWEQQQVDFQGWDIFGEFVKFKHVSFSAIQDQKDSSNMLQPCGIICRCEPFEATSCTAEWRKLILQNRSAEWLSVMLTVTVGVKRFKDGSARGPSWKSKNRSLIVGKIAILVRARVTASVQTESSPSGDSISALHTESMNK